MLDLKAANIRGRLKNRIMKNNSFGSKLNAMIIGRSEPRMDAMEKVRGKTVYASDFKNQEDALHVGVKRAGVRHALIKSIDVEKAKKVDGVLAILTHEDIPGHKTHGVVRNDRPVLVIDRIRYAGDPIALVIAVNETALSVALNKITFDHELLSAVTDPIKALGENAILVHEDNPDGNVLLNASLSYGDPAKAERECSVLIEGMFETPVQEHAYLETESGWAKAGEDGKLVICCSTQTPFRDCYEVAQILRMEPTDIRIIAPYCGGAFGGKDSLSVQAFLGLAALHAGGRTVKMQWSRKESFNVSTKRHSAKMTYRLGCKADGELHFLDVNIVMDTGPYDFLGGVVLTLAVEHSGGPYRIPNSRVNGSLVYTNNCLAGAFRGFGVPQVTAAMEQMMDRLADKLGVCPLELRLKNALRQGDLTSLGKKMTCSTGIVECLETVATNNLWKNRERWKSEAGPGKLRGYGLAALIHGMGYGPFVKDYANAKLQLTDSGRIRLYSGVVDMGQGNASTYAQIAGHILNQSAQDIDLVQPDTFQTLPSCSSSASRTTYTFGSALIGASHKLKAALLRYARVHFGPGCSDDPEIVPGGVIASDGRTITLKRLFHLMKDEDRTSVYYFEAPTAPEVLSSDENLRMQGLPHQIFSFAAHMVFVEVDAATGCIEICRYLSVSDCGAVLNPQIYEQQVHGSIAQGIGYALMEDYAVDSNDEYPDSFTDYILPTACDVPNMECVALGTYEPTGPFGLKGLGEICAAGPLPAISNAVSNACGIIINRYPLTSERIYRAMIQKQTH